MYVQYFSPKNLVVTGIFTHYSRSYNCHNKLFDHSRMSNLKQLGLFLPILAAANDLKKENSVDFQIIIRECMLQFEKQR